MLGEHSARLPVMHRCSSDPIEKGCIAASSIGLTSTWPAVSQKSTETGAPSTFVSCLPRKSAVRALIHILI